MENVGRLVHIRTLLLIRLQMICDIFTKVCLYLPFYKILTEVSASIDESFNCVCIKSTCGIYIRKTTDTV